VTGFSFRPGKSFLYRLHPAVKCFGTFLLIIWFSLHSLSFVYSLAGFAVLLLIGHLGGVSVLDAVRELKNIFLLLAVVAVLNATHAGEHPWLMAGDAVIRICGIFLLSAILVSISPQAELMYFWEMCFQPLGIFGVQTREPALVMVIAVRFFPVILGEIERIKMAQVARGAGIGSGKGFFRRIRGFLPLLIPILVLSVHRASDLAVAMEARAFRLTGPRTRFHEFRIKVADMVAAMLLLAVVLTILIGR